MMNKVKKQHFVPRFYLKRFTNNNGKIFVFDIQTQSQFGTTAENVAHKKFFYDYEPLDKIAGDQSIEKALAHMEGESALVLNKTIELLEKGNLHEQTNKDKAIIAEFIAIQQMRTSESRKRSEQLHTEVERQLKQKGGADFLKNSGFYSANHDPKFIQTINFFSPELEKGIKEYTDRYWIYWDNQTKYNFYTSDNPVVGHIHEKIRFSAYEIFFPLTPRFGLSIALKKEFQNMANYDNKIVPLTNKENIKFYNSLIVTNCNRQIFNNEMDFRLAKKILKKKPELSNPNRQRFARM
ncbi:DUF4238 domain-containing protein [Flammeovirgaceae bacterium SG7u.111]|nr:DUF4238 domain-containing protein [Flammeovirgaceae bacterium SG7u.132]WPO33577.1 DUF4238 domain-containing protein [Flammeovirgaceae bacterium SG7u.111]